ncbi:tyrosine-type recombinase/integrase [Dactylosporangium sp. CA-139066]|uniref:tyrosine-type recombinase/integrase n=1 Tax=Dactylosporangium sp. CA-139066 TaxID=3239930 RepID=UPI003D8AA5A5
MASIEQRASDQFRVKWRAGRGAKWENCTFATEALALRAKQLVDGHGNKIKAEDVYQVVLDLPELKVVSSQADAPPATEVPTVGDWIDTFTGKKKGIQDGVLKEYRRMLDVEVKPVLGGKRLNAVTRDDVDEWVDKLIPRLKPRSIHRYHAVLHQVFALAMGKHIFDNPCTPEPGKKRKNLPAIEPFDAVFLEKAEIAVLVKNCPWQIRDMVDVALGSGMRWGELAALQKQDVSLSGKQVKIHVRRALKANGTVGKPKSKKSIRTITVSRRLGVILRRRLEAIPTPEGVVFPSPSGRIWNANNFRNQYWLRAVASAQRCGTHPPALKQTSRGVLMDPLAVSSCSCASRLHRTPRFHDLRHTHVGLLIDAGWNLYAIQIRIGHESIKTTFDVYGHLRAEGNPEELERLDELMAA